MALIRILLVDDNRLVRAQIKALLGVYPDLQVVGEAGNGEEALTQAHNLAPDVVVMDINMPIINGIEATRLIKSKYPQVFVVGLSVNVRTAIHLLMEQAGSHAVLRKENAADELPAAIRQLRAVSN